MGLHLHLMPWQREPVETNRSERREHRGPRSALEHQAEAVTLCVKALKIGQPVCEIARQLGAQSIEWTACREGEAQLCPSDDLSGDHELRLAHMDAFWW